MITEEEQVEATALRARGWSISAIARHLGRNRDTISDYLAGKRTPGVRARSGPDPLERFVPYLRQRLADDPHVWATALFDEVVALGYGRSYQSFTRGMRARSLRPHCEACETVKGRVTVEIDHPPGEEIQWDWNELPDAPWGGDAHLLVGSLPFSGKFRAVFADAEDQAHLIEAMDAVMRRLGGTARRWRFDRMATVVDPRSGAIQSSFVPVAKHYQVSVVACPPRRGNRKGSVEKSIHYATQRFWRTMMVTDQRAAQASLDRFCERIADRRPRPIARLAAVVGDTEASQMLAARRLRRPTVAVMAELERLAGLPAAMYPAMIVSDPVTVGPSALVCFEGNKYSVPPALRAATVTARHRLGTNSVEIVTGAGTVLAVHTRETPGAGAIVRSVEHHHQLQSDVLSAFSSAPPCRTKQNRPPSAAARTEAARLAGTGPDEVVVDLAAYQAIIEAIISQGHPA